MFLIGIERIAKVGLDYRNTLALIVGLMRSEAWRVWVLGETWGGREKGIAVIAISGRGLSGTNRRGGCCREVGAAFERE